MTKPKRHFTDVQLGEIARQELSGQLWTSTMLQERYKGDLHGFKMAMELSFPILMLMSDKQRRDLAKRPPAMIWENIDRAAPRMINGMPMFFSIRMMFREDYEVYVPIYQKMHDALQLATPRVKKPYKVPNVQSEKIKKVPEELQKQGAKQA
jgi:hypothetical protein